MAINKITNPSDQFTDANQFTLLVQRSSKDIIGNGLSIPIFTLTNWDASPIRPEVAIGSMIEVGGTIYEADANTALIDDGGLVDGTVHIKLVPQGAGDTVNAVLTNDPIPAWDPQKGGWYDMDDKFLPFEMEMTGVSFTEKGEFIDQNKTNTLFATGKYNFVDSIQTDNINESTNNNGVNVDGLTIKDGFINNDNVSLKFKFITGQFPSASANNVEIAHGLDDTKVIGVAPMFLPGSAFNALVGVGAVNSGNVNFRRASPLSGTPTVKAVVFYIE